MLIAIAIIAAAAISAFAYPRWHMQVDSETDMNRQKWMHRLAKITTIVVSTTRTHIFSTLRLDI
jgi:uncharacterized membrane protein